MAPSDEDPLNAAPTGKIWGGPVDDERLQPFHGRWNFVSHTYEDLNVQSRTAAGPDLEIRGHLIRFLAGEFSQELRLCKMHEHHGRLCGFALRGPQSWQHQWTLEIEEDELVLRERIIPEEDSSDAPVFISSGADCTVDSEIDGASPWCVLRYRKQAE